MLYVSVHFQCCSSSWQDDCCGVGSSPVLFRTAAAKATADISEVFNSGKKIAPQRWEASVLHDQRGRCCFSGVLELMGLW
jgi:hypothetical protein